jgi:poly(3-hydroxybutyrate) depolymerase
MISLRSLGPFGFVTLALFGIACSANPQSGGSGGSGPGAGGDPGTGGTAGQGGTGAGGGTTGSGGQTSTGGASATGGRTASGGQMATGGASATGGVTGNGGTRPTGGVTASGGSSSTGGVTSAGGRTGTGGTTNSGGAAGRDAGRDLVPGTGGTGAGGQSGNGGSGGTSTDAGGTSAAVPSVGCGKTPTLASGSRTISSGGSNRSFMLRIPANYDNSHPYPLVFAFHWNGGTMNDIDGGGSSGYTWSYYGLREQADNSTNAKMIFVAPQGNGNGWANPNGQDLTLVDDMRKQLEGDLCVDTTRIFAMGFSYGGGMSYAIACARATAFRAVAVYSGAQLSGCTGGNDPIAYIGIHGIGDTTCNISGGRSLRDRFVKNNTCTAQNPPEPSAGSGKHTCTSYAGCSSGHPVRWCAFDGGHTPGNVDGGGDDGAKTWTKGEVWQFFTQF